MYSRHHLAFKFRNSVSGTSHVSAFMEPIGIRDTISQEVGSRALPSQNLLFLPPLMQLMKQLLTPLDIIGGPWKSLHKHVPIPPRSIFGALLCIYQV